MSPTPPLSLEPASVLALLRGESMAKQSKPDSTAQPNISGSETPPTHGVGGGVVSRKPAARGGRSSVIYGTPPISAPNRVGKSAPLTKANDASQGAGPKPADPYGNVPKVGSAGATKDSKLGAYLKRSATMKPGKRVK